MLQNWCVAWQMGPSGEATSSLEVMKDKTCAKGTAYRLSEEGARRYTEFWLGSESSESLASPLGVTVTMKSGQKLNSTLLVPSLPVRDDGYFSQMWFDACEDANTFQNMLSALSGKDAKTAKTKNLRKVLKTLKQSKKFMKQTARVVCPGSLTERFIACGRSTTHSSLTAFERGLLASGPLSWRWLREEDEDLQAPSSVVVDEEGHRWALREMEMTSADAQRLRRMDSYLQEALWPACPARVSLAERLLSPKARRRRCERYLKEATHRAVGRRSLLE
ncbi:Uncharacterized protein SCF082_LOCUS22610 [Durusdinium trenchii]|uniref:Uncharacterized protein n=1 Tax=Durusdinium trenchii TaxID=1381693 RepID=A0ABP0LIK3_9DINO